MLSFLFLISCVTTSYTPPAEYQNYRVDLNGNGQPEYIIVKENNLIIKDIDGQKIAEIKTAYKPENVDFVSLNKDNRHQIILYLPTRDYSKELRIYALERGNLNSLFQIKYSGLIEKNLDSIPPRISMGIETWLWDGSSFRIR